jgi:hypothetical protein
MLDQLFTMFSSSRQGQGALQQLMSQGYTQQQANGMLQAALPAAANAMRGAAPGSGGQSLGASLMSIGNSNYAQNFLVGAVSGLLRGEGLMGSAVDGLQAVVGGHVAQVIATRFGLPSRVAGAVGAVITPWMIDFLWEKMQGGGASGFNLDALMSGGAPVAAGVAGLGMAGATYGALGAGAPSYSSGFGPPSAGQWVVPGAKGDAGNKTVSGLHAGYGAPMGGVFNKDSKKSMK